MGAPVLAPLHFWKPGLLPPNTTVVETADDLACTAAESVIAALDSATANRQSICLSGGTTPLNVYRTLGQGPYRERIPWRTLHLFWGDERFVPSDHADNNVRQALEAFGDAPIPPENIHFIATVGMTQQASADAYEGVLKAFADPQSNTVAPLFDVAILGLGQDGHTASLYPGQLGLDTTDRWVIAVPQADQPPYVPRISLTVRTLSSSRVGLFLVSGAENHAALAAIGAGEDTPAARIRSQNLRWLVTSDAAYG